MKIKLMSYDADLCENEIKHKIDRHALDLSQDQIAGILAGNLEKFLFGNG